MSIVSGPKAGKPLQSQSCISSVGDHGKLVWHSSLTHQPLHVTCTCTLHVGTCYMHVVTCCLHVPTVHCMWWHSGI